MPPAKRSPKSNRKLVNDLTVDEARHLLRLEGGERGHRELVFQLLSAVAVATLSARAIVVGNATVWHLAAPMLAQYFAIILPIPVLYLLTPHPELRRYAVSCTWLLAGYLAAAAIAMGVRCWLVETPWHVQIPRDAAVAWHWIYDAQMHWPMLLAFCSEAGAMPGRVRNLFEHGPPFVSIDLGCAMRFIVLMVGCFSLPWLVGSATRMAWFLWAMISVAEVMALWMHWDIQRRLRKVDGEGAK